MHAHKRQPYTCTKHQFRQGDAPKWNYRLAYIAHGRKLISFRLLALNDSPRLSFTLLNYIDQL
jgi:hypothetical protein